MNKDIIWRQRKRLWCRLPWTFTIYSFSSDRFFVETGLLSKKYSELRFYRVLDISMEKSFLQRIFGLGSIYLMSNDQDSPTLEIKNIPDVEMVKETLSDTIEKARSSKKVRVGEFLDGDTTMMM
jgi:uncharacterized membrane protein YdbT with pleckstrin-like domain